MTEDKVRENRLRRMAERQGRKLWKSRRRDPRAADYGGYMLLDARTNAVIAGGSPFEFSLTLDDVESWVSDDILLQPASERDLPIKVDALGRPTLQFFPVTYPMNKVTGSGPGRGWYLFTADKPSPVYWFLGGPDDADSALQGARRYFQHLWELVRVDDDDNMRQHYEVINRTGNDARAVRMAAVGSLIIDDRQGWSKEFERIEKGRSESLTRVHGWSDEKSGVRISWQSEDGHQFTQTLLISDLNVYPRPIRQ